GDLADLHGMQEIEIIHRAQHDRAPRDAGGGHGPGLRDPLHHSAAVNLPRSPRVLGKDPLDHLDRGIRYRRHFFHMGGLDRAPEPPTLLEKREPPAMTCGGTPGCITRPDDGATRPTVAARVHR